MEEAIKRALMMIRARDKPIVTQSNLNGQATRSCSPLGLEVDALRLESAAESGQQSSIDWSVLFWQQLRRALARTAERQICPSHLLTLRTTTL